MNTDKTDTFLISKLNQKKEVLNNFIVVAASPLKRKEHINTQPDKWVEQNISMSDVSHGTHVKGNENAIRPNHLLPSTIFTKSFIQE